MKKTVLFFGFATLVICINVIFTVTGCSEEKSTTKTDSVLVSAITNQYAIAPIDITQQSQALADSFSWRTFIAMNWPANGSTCGPDTTGGTILSGAGPVVWETYLSVDQVFVASGSQPQGWCEAGANGRVKGKMNLANLPKQVQDLANKTGIFRFIHRTSKSPHGLNQASGQPLVDQNGRFVRYEVRMNHDEYNYIMAKTLWNAAGQQQYTQDSTINFPGGPTSYGPIGAMEFKAAWKILGQGDDPTKFYTIKAIVFNDDSLNPSPGPNPVTLGLVGLHIGHKTATQRFWVWSTFEQVNNLTSSFNNPNCDTCPVNTPPQGGPNYKELAPDGTPLHKPTQVTRVNPVDSAGGDPFIDNINTYYQGLLNGSVWANYKLVSTQWLLNEDIFPLFLANTTQETYLQGPNPPTYGNFKILNGEQYFQSPKYHPFAPGISSSCMGCHSKATINNSQKSSDFSFMLGEAQ